MAASKQLPEIPIEADEVLAHVGTGCRTAKHWVLNCAGGRSAALSSLARVVLGPARACYTFPLAVPLAVNASAVFIGR